MLTGGNSESFRERGGENGEGRELSVSSVSPCANATCSKDWDRTSLLGRIKVPTLITVGGYDELPLACSETIHKGIPGSRVVLFEKSAHCAHLEETEKYNRTVADFLKGVEGV